MKLLQDLKREMLAVWHGKYEAWILEQAGIEFAQEQAGLKLVNIA